MISERIVSRQNSIQKITLYFTDDEHKYIHFVLLVKLGRRIIHIPSKKERIIHQGKIYTRYKQHSMNKHPQNHHQTESPEPRELIDRHETGKENSYNNHKHQKEAAKAKQPRKKYNIKKVREKGFVLNCINENESKLPYYDSTRDKYLKYFFIRSSSSGALKSLSKTATTNIRPKHQKLRYNSPQHGVPSQNEATERSSSRKGAVVLPEIKYRSNQPVINKSEFDEFLRKKIQEVQAKKVNPN